MENIYYNPEKFGLKIYTKIELNSCYYDFDSIVVWLDRNNYLWWYRDSGWSCPQPFDNIDIVDLLPIKNNLDIFHLIDECSKNRIRCGYPTLSKQMLFINKLRLHFKKRGESSTMKKIKLPKGCKCEPESWEECRLLPVNDICKCYKKSDTDDEYCVTCLHDKECHKINIKK